MIPDHLTFSTAAVIWQRDAIPARGEDVVTYDIPLSALGRGGALRLGVRLLYRVARPELILSNLRINMAIPTFTLAEMTADIPGPTN